MVAESERHYDNDVLQQLLDDSLSSADASRIERHLSSCDQCRSELEEIAGEKSWWHETVGALSDSTLGQSVGERRDASSPLDPSIDWIRPLLDPSDDGQLGRIDRYPIEEVVGQGGMGVVLRGTDPELHRPVAIKILAPHLAGVGAARARFMREAQAAASIVHPSIVPIYGVITSARLPYIVMPYIRGGNLQQRIDREGPLPLREVLRIGMQIAEGLSAAHRIGVIHRDIKPANMLVEEGNGRVLISDFGLARALDDATLTNSGMISGTPQYMSPEQARGDVTDARSDLFSLGSLLYALSTGRPPFRAETPLGVLRKVTETTPKLASQINEQIPPWFDRLLSRLMEIEVDQRVQSADDAAELLRNAHAHVNNPAVATLPESLIKSHASIAGWKYGLASIVVAAIVTAAVIFAGLDNSVENDSTAPRIQPQTERITAVAPQTIIQSESANDLEWYGLEEEIEAINFDLDQLSNSLDQ